jgi:hypothetical protein
MRATQRQDHGMSRPFITPWSQEQLAFERQVLSPGTILRHTASKRFRSAGVRPGDRVYVLATEAGVVLLLGRIVVDRVVGRRTAQRILRRRDLYDAPDHIIGAGTTFGPDRVVPKDVARALRRASRRPLKIDAGTYRIDPQTLRRTGEIEQDSADLLDLLLDGAITVGLGADNYDEGAHGCHRMLHRETPPLSVAALGRIVVRQRRRARTGG